MTGAALVTGVTGFLGREVARRLMATGHPITALARTRDGVRAADRVAAALGVAHTDARLDVVEGDFILPRCGVAPPEWRRLCGTVETVVHCAGDTTFTPHRLEPYETAHVDGPRRLLAGLASGRLRRWVHVSTAYVCGRRTGVVLESEGDVGQSFHNVYERVKLAAEAAVRSTGARTGVDVRVARPGIVIGVAPPTAGGTPASLLFEFIRMAAALAPLSRERQIVMRIEAAPAAPCNFVPLDYVAAAIAYLAQAPGIDGATLHLVAPGTPTQAAVLEMIAGRLGVRGLSLVQRLHDPGPLERRLSRALAAYRPYLTRHVCFDDTHARRCLSADIASRAPLSARTLHALIDLALTTGARTPEPWPPVATPPLVPGRPSS